MNKSDQFVNNLKEARDSQSLFTLNRLRDAAKKKHDRELLEETWMNLCLITEAMNGALCRVNNREEACEIRPDSDVQGEEDKPVMRAYLVTLSGVIKGRKDLTDAVEGLTTRFKKLNPYVILFYFPEDTEDTFKRLMKRMGGQDLFMVNLTTGRTVSHLEDYSFLAESKGVRVVKDSDEGTPGEEE